MPLQVLAREVDGIERAISDLISKAFGLTKEDILLMRQSITQRVPLTASVNEITKMD